MGIRRAGAVVAGLLALAACGGGDGASGGSGGSGGRPRVVAAFYPLAEAAIQVGGDAVDVTNLTPAGTEPHDVELTSGQVDLVEDADVVLYVGGGFQPAIEEVAERSGGVDVLDGLPIQGGGDPDPHVWLDPELMIEIVDVVEDTLARARPGNAGSFADNARTYRDELRRLGDDYRAGLERCERRLLVTSHAAYGYLARRYGLRQEALAGLSPESEPSPGRMAALADLVRAEGVTTVFTETLAPPRVAEALAREAGVEVAVLDPLEGLAQDEIDRGASYLSVMRDNLAALRAGLGCR